MPGGGARDCDHQEDQRSALKLRFMHAGVAQGLRALMAFGKFGQVARIIAKFVFVGEAVVGSVVGETAILIPARVLADRPLSSGLPLVVILHTRTATRRLFRTSSKARFDTKIFGLFHANQTQTQTPFGHTRLLLLTRYASHGVWEDSRDPSTEAMVIFAQRQLLTRHTIASSSLLVTY